MTREETKIPWDTESNNHKRKCCKIDFIRVQHFSWGPPSGSHGKESACHVGDLGSTPGLGRSPGEGKGYPLQYSGLEKSMDCVVQRVTKSQA